MTFAYTKYPAVAQTSNDADAIMTLIEVFMVELSFWLGRCFLGGTLVIRHVLGGAVDGATHCPLDIDFVVEVPVARTG